tara:strand:+ start:1021 stop:1599 length:579 start_codon:yes stop_codon:yes gene_type:complete
MKSSLKYDSTNMMVFAFVGILIKLFFGNNTTADGSSGPASSAVWGYGIVALSIFSILFITFALATQMTAVSQYNTMDFIMKLVQGSLVPFLMLLILVWLISINLTFYKRINEGNVASEYNQFSTVSTILVVVQLMVLFKYLKDAFKVEKGGQNGLGGAHKSQMASITYVLTALNVIFIGMMNIVVAYFSTDG